MRQILEMGYLALLRGQGVAGIVVGLLFFWNLQSQLSQDLHMLVPSLITLVGFALCVAYAVPKLTPRWLRRPFGWPGAGALAVHTVAPIIFMTMVMSAIIPMDIGGEVDAESAKPLAVSLSMMAFLGSGLCWWLALILIFVKPEDLKLSSKEIVEIFADEAVTEPEFTPKAPPPVSTQDLRALRKSRMA